MDPVEAFLSSVRVAFGSRDGDDAFWRGLAILACAIALLVGFLSLRARRRRRDEERAAVAALAAERRLAADEVAAIAALARAADVPVPLAMTSFAAFERVTARALARRGRPPLATALPEPWAGVARLREALRFSPLPAHAPLLTTRELSPGAELRAAGEVGRVVEVNEAFFSVDVAAVAGLEIESVVPFEIVRPAEARYTFGCRLLAVETRAGRRLFFAHDEAPKRVQLRDAVRVRVQRPVTLELIEQSGSPRAAFSGVTVDVSAGGLMVEADQDVPPGALVKCSFELGPAAIFTGLLARVVRAAPIEPAGPADARRHRLHLAFPGLERPDQDRLFAAVAALDRESAAALRAERHASGDVVTTKAR